MKGFANWAYNASWFTLGIVVASILLFGVVAVQAATTISANISTGGTLDVSGLSSLAGFQSTASSSVSSTFRITGLETQVAGFISQASSTVSTGQFTVVGAVVGSSTLQVTGATTIYGGTTNSSSGTSTLTLSSTSATKGFCIQAAATSSATSVYFVATTTGQGTGFGGVMLVGNFGTCP